MVAAGVALRGGFEAARARSDTLAPEPPRPVQRPALRIVAPPPRQDDARSEPAPIRQLPVSGDLPAFVAPGAPGATVVYLHGFCGDPRRIDEWAPTAQRHATVVAIYGDAPCRNRPGRYRFTADMKYLDYRIRRALGSVGKGLGRSLDGPIVLVGYSEGAQRAEDLAWVYPDRYRRVALMSGPATPSFLKLRGAARVAVTRGGREYRRNYRISAEQIERGGVEARYFELPKAAHGEFGPDAPRVMGTLFDWLLASAADRQNPTELENDAF